MEINFDEKLLVNMRVDTSYDEPILDQVLRIAVYDEYHAYETYRAIIGKFGEQDPFVNIIEAEIRHFSALEPLLTKYSVEIPINNWEEKLIGEIPNTLLECCEIGVAAEIDNIKMYDNLLLYAGEYPDIQDTLYRLQAASYNNHLPAFRRCVAQYSSSTMDSNIPMNDKQMMGKVDEFRNIATKLSSGKLSQEDMAKVFSSMDMSTIGGLLLGGLGVVQLLKALEKDDK